MKQFITSLSPRTVVGVISALVMGTFHSQAAALTWGPNGAGGSGSWDASTANWWDGVQNVPWSDGGAAIFAGTGGAVTVSSTNSVSVSSIVFDAPGYTLNGQNLQSGNTLGITANSDATIVGPLPYLTFMKDGMGTLSINQAASQTYGVSAGRLRVTTALGGYAIIQGGTLETAGNIGTLRVAGAGTLDIGGYAAAQLSLSGFSYLDDPSTKLTIRFGLGSTAQDSLSIDPFTVVPSTGAYYFDFENLGGLATGVSYTLISQGKMTPSSFHLSPELVDQGWVATFSPVTQVFGQDPQGLKVTFAAIPEPSAGSLALFGVVALAGVGFMKRRQQPKIAAGAA